MEWQRRSCRTVEIARDEAGQVGVPRVTIDCTRCQATFETEPAELGPELTCASCGASGSSLVARSEMATENVFARLAPDSGAFSTRSAGYDIRRNSTRTGGSGLQDATKTRSSARWFKLLGWSAGCVILYAVASRYLWIPEPKPDEPAGSGDESAQLAAPAVDSVEVELLLNAWNTARLARAAIDADFAVTLAEMESRGMNEQAAVVRRAIEVREETIDDARLRYLTHAERIAEAHAEDAAAVEVLLERASDAAKSRADFVAVSMLGEVSSRLREAHDADRGSVRSGFEELFARGIGDGSGP